MAQVKLPPSDPRPSPSWWCQAENTNSTFPLPQDRGLFLPQPLGSSPKTRNEEPAGDQLLQWSHHRQSRPGLGDSSSLATVTTAAEQVAIDSSGPSRGQMERDISSENTQRCLESSLVRGALGRSALLNREDRKLKAFTSLQSRRSRQEAPRCTHRTQKNRILLL